MKKLVFFALAIILVLSGVLVGCGGTTTTTATQTATQTSTQTVTSTATSTATTTATTTSTTTATVTATPTNPLGDLAKPAGGKGGGRLQLVGAGNIANIGDPNAISNPGDAAYAFPVIEPLLVIGSDGNIKPWLAEKFEIAPDGSSITLYLRHGVSFSDGTPFNAEAAKYNLDNGINSKVWPNMQAVQDCTIVDDYTVKVNFKNGKFDWGATKSMAGFFSCDMFSPTSLQNNDEDWQRTHVVGTGPFILTSFQRDQKLTYDANPNYWRGAPYLNGVDYNIIPDTTTQLLAYKSGEVDAIGVQASDAQDLISSGYQILTSTDMIINLCLIPSSNNPDSPLAKLKVRQAVESAIDKQALVDGLSYGYGHVSNQEFTENLATYDPTVVGNPYNPDRAKELLTEAGYPDGFTTQLWMADFIPMDLPLALQDQLSKVGITLQVKKISIVQLNDMIATGGQGWEGFMYSFGFPGTTTDPASTLLNGPLNGNTTWISCNEPQELLDLAAKAAGEIDQTKRNQDYQEISKKMEDTYLQWIFLYWSPTLTSVAPYVKGVTMGKYTEFWPYTFAYLDK